MDEGQLKARLDNVVKKEYHFDFGVYNITEAQAATLLDMITALAEGMEGSIGGGYRDYEATPDTA